MVAALINKIISLFIVLFAGYLIVRFKIVKAQDSKIISLILVYLITPCVIISAFQVDSTPELQSGLLLTLAAAVIIQTANILILTVLRKPLKLDPVELCSSIYPNCGNLIVPLVSSMLGPEWVVYTCTFTCVQIAYIWTHCKAVISQEKKIDFRKILLNANMISIYFGIIIFIFGIRFPAPVKDSIDSIASMVGPLSMVIIGMLIGSMDIRRVFTYKRVWFITAMRLLIIPLMVLGFLAVMLRFVTLSNEKTILMITMLQACAPAAAYVTQLSQLYGGDEQYASAINVVSTLMCMFTMPLIIALYELI